MENKFHEWRLTHWDIKKHKFVIPHMGAYGMSRAVTDRLAAYEELGFTPQQLDEIIKELNRYYWSISLYDLLQQVEEIRWT